MESLDHLAPLVRRGRHACLVVGNRRVKGVQLATDQIIAEMAVPLGFVPEPIVVRSIPNKTMPLRNSPSNVAGALEDTMHREYIVVLRRD